MTMDEVLNIMEFLQSNLPSGQKTESERAAKLQMMAWHHHLSAVPYDVAISVAMDMVGDMNTKFMPTIGEFKSKVTRHLYPQIGELSPLEAWDKARRKIGAWGRDRKDRAYSELTEPTIAAIEAFGGWVRFCDLFEEDMVSNRARFIETYKVAEQRQLDSITAPEKFAQMLENAISERNKKGETLPDGVREALEGGIEEPSATGEPFVTPEKIRAAQAKYERERGKQTWTVSASR